MSAGFQPTLRRRRMVGEAEAVNPGRFGGRGHFPDALPADQLRVVGMAVHRVSDGEVHGRRQNRARESIAVSLVRSGRISASWANETNSSPSSECTVPRTYDIPAPTWVLSWV